MLGVTFLPFPASGPPGPPGVFNLIAQTFVTGAPGGGTSSAIDTTGANLLIAQVVSGAIASISDSMGNTWIPLTPQSNIGVEALIFYCASPIVGSGHTFTAGTAFCAAGILAFSGAAASPFDQENGAVDSQSPGSITPTQDGELIVSTIGIANGGGPITSVDSGFTIYDNQDFNSGVNYGETSAYLIQSTAAAINPTFSPSTTNSWVVIASFKHA